MTLGQKIRTEREACGISQKQLAAAAHISAPSLSNIERGVTDPTLSTLFALASELELTPSELLEGVTDLAAGRITRVPSKSR